MVVFGWESLEGREGVKAGSIVGNFQDFFLIFPPNSDLLQHLQFS